MASALTVSKPEDYLLNVIRVQCSFLEKNPAIGSNTPILIWRNDNM